MHYLSNKYEKRIMVSKTKQNKMNEEEEKNLTDSNNVCECEQ